MKPAIQVDRLGKQYRLGENGKLHYRTLRESLSEAAGRAFRRARGTQSAAPPTADRFWALNDVSFDVEAGEVIGIIGRNGAGKSTLLKILSRITEPTKGRAAVRGRVGSLLEVGTGFHPELTGRENVYMNGSILGMSRRDISRDFDAIVDFAEMNSFVDTPVKRYSSGMYVRLAFAVAAYLNPDILIVDEVLSVGDYAFQAKSRARMHELQTSGTTVLFVSHNLQAVSDLCRTCVVLDAGRTTFIGECSEAIRQYYRVMSGQRSRRTNDGAGASADAIERRVILGGADIEAIELFDADSHQTNALRAGEVATCRVHVSFKEKAIDPHPAFFIKTPTGHCVYDVNSVWRRHRTGTFQAGCRYVLTWNFRCNLIPGRYFIGADLARPSLDGYYDRAEFALSFDVVGDSGAQGIADLAATYSAAPA